MAGGETGFVGESVAFALWLRWVSERCFGWLAWRAQGWRVVVLWLRVASLRQVRYQAHRLRVGSFGNCASFRLSPVLCSGFGWLLRLGAMVTAFGQFPSEGLSRTGSWVRAVRLAGFGQGVGAGLSLLLVLLLPPPNNSFKPTPHSGAA